MRTLAIALVAAFVGLNCAACSASAARDSEFTVLETKASDETKAKIKELFTRSTSFEIYYAPQESRIPFGRKEVIDEARYRFRVSCRSSCFEIGAKLSSTLSEGRRIKGACPEILYAALRFYDADGKVIDTGYVISGGQCFDLNFGSFFLPPEMTLRPVLERLEQVSK